jgi:hypothetical protein
MEAKPVNGVVVIKCDFCEAEINKSVVQEQQLSGWTWGRRGMVMSLSGCYLDTGECRHACPKELCKARLLVWARS